MPSRKPKLQPVTPATKQRPAAAPHARDLTEFQKFVCDTAADLIFNGGHEDDLGSLVWALAGHYYRRRFDGLPNLDDVVDKFVKDNIADWSRQFAGSWPADGSSPVKEKRPRPQGATERILANKRRELMSQFEDFVSSATPVEQRLMYDILLDWESGSKQCPDRPDADPEIELARAFMYQIDGCNFYLKVSEKHRKAVEEFLALLDRGCLKPAA